MIILHPEILRELFKHLNETEPRALLCLSWTCRYLRAIGAEWTFHDISIKLRTDGSLDPRDADRVRFLIRNDDFGKCVRKVFLDAADLIEWWMWEKVQDPATDEEPPKSLEALPKLVKQLLMVVPVRTVIYQGSSNTSCFEFFIMRDKATPEELRAQLAYLPRKLGSKIDYELLEILAACPTLENVRLDNLHTGPTRALLYKPPALFASSLGHQIRCLSIVDSDPLLLTFIRHFPNLNALQLSFQSRNVEYRAHLWAGNARFWQTIQILCLHGPLPPDWSEFLAVSNEAITKGDASSSSGLQRLGLYMHDMSEADVVATLESLRPFEARRFDVLIALWCGDDFYFDLARLMRNLSKLSIYTRTHSEPVDIFSYHLPDHGTTFSKFKSLRVLRLVSVVSEPFPHRRFYTRQQLAYPFILVAKHCQSLTAVLFCTACPSDDDPEQGFWRVVRRDEPDIGIFTDGKIVLVSDEEVDRDRSRLWRQGGIRGDDERLFEIREDQLERYKGQTLKDLNSMELLAENGWRLDIDENETME